MVTVRFEGIDSWSRPIFKDTESNARYGDTDNLFSSGTKEAVVIKSVTPLDLVFFGNRFDCEPMGSLPKDTLRIIT